MAGAAGRSGRRPKPTAKKLQLPTGADVDMHVQAAGAEIERREGYETELRVALTNCKRLLTTK